MSRLLCKNWCSCEYHVLNCWSVLRNAQTVFSKVKHISPSITLTDSAVFWFQLNSSSQTRMERERKPLKIYNENTILFDDSHTSSMHNPKRLWKKSNEEENQRLWSSIKKRKYGVLLRLLHECFINIKEACKLRRSVHVNCQQNKKKS